MNKLNQSINQSNKQTNKQMNKQINELNECKQRESKIAYVVKLTQPPEHGFHNIKHTTFMLIQLLMHLMVYQPLQV